MLDDQLMEEASKGSGTGLGDVLYKQLSKQMKAVYKPEKGEK
jgi:Rod binding domain-containing protein